MSAKPDRAIEFSRSGESGLFGKCDIPLTVNVSEETCEHLKAEATIAEVPLGEFVRAVLEAHVWGTAAVMKRVSQKRALLGIR